MRNRLLLNRILFLLKRIAAFKIFSDLIEFRKMIAVVREGQRHARNVNEKVDLGYRVSIIIPARNEEKSLPGLLESIASQTYSNIEVIVVDCMSSDNTEQIAKAFQAKVVCVDKQSIGYSSNKGAAASTGQIIIRCDADSKFLPNHVETIVRAFTLHSHVKVVFGGHYFYDGNFVHNFLGFLYDKYWRPAHAFPGYMTAILRHAYFEVGGYSLEKPRDEDWDLGRRIVDKFGRQDIFYDRRLFTLISSRNIRKHGLFSYILRGGSYANITDDGQIKVPNLNQESKNSI